MIIKHLIQLLKNRKYKTIKVHHHRLIIDPHFDLGLREYYNFVTQLCIDSISQLPLEIPAHTFTLGIDEDIFIKKNIQKKLVFQVEHTLVKPGGRGSADAPLSTTRIHNTHDFYLVRIQNQAKLINYDLIMEYSRPNFKHIRDSKLFNDYLQKVCVISPTLYPLNTQLISKTHRQINTITLFRDTNQARRRQFLEKLREYKIPFQNINHRFKNLEEVYLNTKILINIRQTDHHDTLEELRILAALRCGVIVISENAPLKEYCRYSNFILWGNIEDLPMIIQDVQKNYLQYHQNIFNASFYTRMQRLEKSNQLRSHQAISHLANLI